MCQEFILLLQPTFKKKKMKEEYESTSLTERMSRCVCIIYSWDSNKAILKALQEITRIYYMWQVGIIVLQMQWPFHLKHKGK